MTTTPDYTTSDALARITVLRGMQYRTDAGRILDALETDVRRLTTERDHAYQVCTKAEHERDDARAALRAILAIPVPAGRVASNGLTKAQDVAHRALGQDTPPEEFDGGAEEDSSCPTCRRTGWDGQCPDLWHAVHGIVRRTS